MSVAASCLGELRAFVPSPAAVDAAAAIMGVQPMTSGEDRLREFHTPDMKGLCRVDGDTLHLVAVIAPVPGTGAFRRFIASAKREFATIYVWEVWNPWLGGVLQRYGFGPARGIEDNGDTVTGYRWRRPAGEADHA